MTVPLGPTIADVDAAVRAVLAALRPAPAPGCNGMPGVGPGGMPVFPGRLLGERDATALVRSGVPVQITPGTVVTPLARDILKRAGIELRYASHAALAASGQTGEWAIAFEPASGPVGPLRKTLLGGSEHWTDLGDDPMQAVAWVADGPARGALVLTGSTALVAWRANQVTGVRAATATEPASVARAIEELGLNLLVVDPAGRSIFELRHLAAVFRRGGAPRPPAWLGGGEGSLHDADRRDHRPGDPVPRASEPAERSLLDRITDASGRPPGGFARAW